MVSRNMEFQNSIALLDISDIATIAPFVGVLDEHSKALAADEGLRLRVGESTPRIWPSLRRLWDQVAETHSSGVDEDGNRQIQLRLLCFSLARFTRNLVAAVPSNQTSAFENEPSIRGLIHLYTSYAATQNEESLAVLRMLVQTLSNLMTANENLTDKLWRLYLQLPEEKLVLIRLLNTPDASTAVATFVLLLNSLNGSRARIELLMTSQNGPRICVTYLDRIASLFDASDKDSSQAFEIGYRLFSNLTEEGIIPVMYSRIGMDEEVVTPHQTTLLKLLDAFLQPSNPVTSHLPAGLMFDLCVMVTTAFFTLTSYTQSAIRRAIGSGTSEDSQGESTSQQAQDTISRDNGPVSRSIHNHLDNKPLEELDLLLPKVCEALVLVTQCLISLALLSEERITSPANSVQKNNRPTGSADGHLKDYINGAQAHGEWSVEALIETLRLLDMFLPRITFGKVAPTPVPVGDVQDGLYNKVASAQDPNAGRRETDTKGFSYLKRDLVRLLGILVSDRKEAQDRVRACGGIPAILNLCVIDDRNPYLREHAIFTLRNVLHGNPENQAAVREIQPLGEWEKPGTG